ncbi:C4-dicarboxylate TRAP transporter substrate-binding protein [Terasakiella pusilla]|uniref:C4-dicarboxylate TRAP transporter substrate-binding protein n=1 Tax=Terasakiella pusilla TaxID=64973 RepID=UPI003AA99A6A
MKKSMLLALGAYALASVTSVDANASQTLTASSWTGPTHIFTVNDYTNFSKSVEEASKGELTMDVHIGGSLLPAKSVLEGVRDGVADVGNILSAYTPADLPLSNIMNDLAFTFNDPMAAAFASTEYQFNSEMIQKEWLDHNVVFGGGVSTARYNFACVPPVRTLADLEGKKVRTAGGSQVEWVKFAGGIPVSVPFTDVYTGLERGSIDCVMLDATNLSSGFKIWEVAKSVTMLYMGTIIAGAEWIYNKDTWNGFSDETKRLLMTEMAKANARRQIDFANQVDDALKGSWERGLERIEPDQTLITALTEFKAGYVSRLPEFSESKRNVPADKAAKLIADFQEVYDRWVNLLATIDRQDEAQVINLVKTEIYDKIDVSTYAK